jgi:hypothetical protein
MTAEPASSNDIIVLQREIIKLIGRKPFGKRLLIDGIYGPITEKAAKAVNQLDLLNGLKNNLGTKYHFRYNRLGEKIEVGASSVSSKDNIMNYLAESEGTDVHFNEGEKDITSPYGIYKGEHPHTEMFRFIDKVAKANNLDVIKDMDKLNVIFNNQYFNEVRNVAWSFYVKEFLDVKLMSKLGAKSALSVFSNSVNSGKVNGIKSLQYGIGVKPDGIIGAKTMKAVNAIDSKDDDILNQKILEYMDRFYKSLVAQDPSKYYKFLDGWMNRLKRLGYNT